MRRYAIGMMILVSLLLFGITAAGNAVASKTALYPYLDNESGLWGYMDAEGRDALPPRYTQARLFSDGVAAVCQNDVWQYIDDSGATVLTPESGTSSAFHEGLAAIRSGECLGFIDKSGAVVIPAVWPKAFDFSEGLCVVQDGSELWGYIDKTGALAIPCRYEQAWSFSQGLASVKMGGLYGCIDPNGEAVIPFLYEWSVDFCEGLAQVETPNRSAFGFIDRSGRMILDLREEYLTADNFSEGLCAVKRLRDEATGAYPGGYIDKTGAFFPVANADYCDEYRAGRAIFKKGELWGVLDEAQRVVVDARFTGLGAYYDGGIARATINEREMYIDLQGNIVREWVNPKYEPPKKAKINPYIFRTPEPTPAPDSVYCEASMPVSLGRGEWTFSGGKIKMRVKICNDSECDSVKAVTVYMYCMDKYGERMGDSDKVYYKRSKMNLKPGKEKYSAYCVMPNQKKVARVYAAIASVEMASGEVFEPADEELEYLYYDIRDMV